MIEPQTKWQEFYITGQYKGFRKSRERQYKLMGTTHVTFTNGDREFFASGQFREEALAKIFSRIDKHIAN